MTEEAAEVTHHRRALDLINSSIPSTNSTKCFPAKWQSIRDKLEQLSSILAVCVGENNPAITKLVQAVASTARETQLLADRCTDKVYSGGKLQLRSDLDVLNAKLELHIKRLSGTSAVSGPWTASRAIILSKPRASATRDEMRFYVKDLFARLKVGESEIQARALISINEILREDDKYVRIVAAETVDAVTLLVSLLGETGSIQDAATEAVVLIAGFDCYNGSLITAGAIAQLVTVLEKGSSSAKERAAKALKLLTKNSENAWSVSSHGGVTVLLKICGGGGSAVNMELIGAACSILRNLSGVLEIKKFMVEQGLISVLVELSRSKNELNQIRAIEFLSSLLASEDSAIKEAALTEGTLDSLVQVLDPGSPSSSKARELALRAIEKLCLNSPSVSSMNTLMDSGFLHRLLFYIRNGEMSVQESALKAVFGFCGVSQKAKKAMGEVGFMQEMVKLQEAKSSEVRQMAAEALCSMVSVQRNRRLFIGEEHSVNRLLQLLDPEQHQKSMMTKKSLLSVLMNLADSSSGRRKLAASGYVKNLEKLAETDVVEAKKIVKKISSSRLRNVLGGIWRSYHNYNH